LDLYVPLAPWSVILAMETGKYQGAVISYKN